MPSLMNHFLRGTLLTHVLHGNVLNSYFLVILSKLVAYLKKATKYLRMYVNC